ncbi:MAG: L-glutamate gamma-semialdehyde dehydrogenase [Calditrichaeota bacterium]|jgi:1-pyrroline-5-carboxylate dehydrogenase|nr:L-glutamate gamma-semialdehyde dehydrogenase [Calditrichota bacterium]MBT7788399.1 L-glutamate gamma-semialdehyde dehydrogenase [Calditrichota bacterium]
MLPEFRNEPFTDFSKPENRAAMEAAIEKVHGELGKRYPIVIDGEHILEGDTFKSYNPARKDEVIGEFTKGTKEMALRAVDVAHERFEEWRKVDPNERARYLIRAAAILRRRKFEFAAWQVVEVSKNWAEADGDVAEAIDFLEFYGREMMRISEPQPVVPYPGEENELYYVPLGVSVVIPPWNFPGAIMIGMTTAAVVTGNTVILKPASTAPTVAWKFFEILEEIMLPAGVVNFLPGPGSAIGDTIVDHPKTRLIAFTGSKEIGLRISNRAAQVNDGQIWIKRTILEMGGKDFILVDETADIEAAADGIVAAAYGFQGQKCSACSRAIIHESIYDELVAKVVERSKKIKVGEPDHMASGMGAVIDQWAYENILGYIETGKKENRLVLGGNKAGDGGWFIEPTIFADVDGNDTIAQEEIFGPVLACIKCSSFEDGIKIANSTEFGLTGALFSSDRRRLEIGRRDLHCGNLYLNRKCTGALVGVQPFGGFNMSGTDSKAGGRDYLLLFTQGKSVTEKF